MRDVAEGERKSLSGGSPSLGRRVISGAVLIGGAGAIARLFSLVSAPILTAAVSPAQYGVAALVSTVVSLSSTVALFGIDMSYARYWAGGAAADSAAVERFCWRFLVAGCLLLALVASLVWAQALATRVDASPSLALMVAAGVFSYAFSAMSQTRTRFRGAYRTIATAVIVSAAVSTLLSIMLALRWKADAWALLTGGILGMLSGVLIMGIPSAGSFLASSGLDRQRRQKIVELGLAGTVTAAMYWVIGSSDRWFIGLFRDQHELGIYSFASNIGMSGLVFNSAVIATWFPEATLSYEQNAESAAAPLGREWARLVVLLIIVWLAVASSGGDIIRLLAHPRFHEGARYVPWVAAGVLLYGIASIANTGLWVAKDMKPNAIWWLCGAVTSLILNTALVRSWGAMGAALTSCASFGLIALGVSWSAHRKFPLLVPRWRVFFLGLLALIAGVPMTVSWHGSPAYSLCLKFPVGVLVGALILYRGSPESFWSALNMAQSWLRARRTKRFVRNPK